MSQVTLPAPTTYANGVLQASELTEDVTNAVAWLSQPPLFVGLQTTAAQNVSNATFTAVTLDQDNADTVNGHRVADLTSYYAMQPGWYLCEAFAPLNYTGSTGTISAGIGGKSGGSAITNRMGERCIFPSAISSACAAHLIEFSNTGTYGGGSNDFIQLLVYQTTTASQHLFNGTSNPGRTPYLSCYWVGATSGTTGLPVPANASWPTPTSYLTTTFMNTNIRDTINFLIYPPMVSVFYNGSGNVASAGAVPALGTAISLGSNVLDNYGAYSGSTWTAPVNGVYYCYGQVGMQSRTTSVALGAGLNVNSGNYGGSNVTLWGAIMSAWAVASDSNCAIVRRRLRLNAGDTVQLTAFQNDSGGNNASINTAASQWPTHLIILWRSA